MENGHLNYGFAGPLYPDEKTMSSSLFMSQLPLDPALIAPGDLLMGAPQGTNAQEEEQLLCMLSQNINLQPSYDPRNSAFSPSKDASGPPASMWADTMFPNSKPQSPFSLPLIDTSLQPFFGAGSASPPSLTADEHSSPESRRRSLDFDDFTNFVTPSLVEQQVGLSESDVSHSYPNPLLRTYSASPHPPHSPHQTPDTLSQQLSQQSRPALQRSSEKRKSESIDGSSDNAPAPQQTKPAKKPRKPRKQPTEEEKEVKRNRFLASNREAAAKCRAKKKEQEKKLQERAHELERNTKELRRELEDMTRAKEMLEEALNKHKVHGCEINTSDLETKSAAAGSGTAMSRAGSHQSMNGMSWDSAVDVSMTREAGRLDGPQKTEESESTTPEPRSPEDPDEEEDEPESEQE